MKSVDRSKYRTKSWEVHKWCSKERKWVLEFEGTKREVIDKYRELTEEKEQVRTEYRWVCVQHEIHVCENKIAGKAIEDLKVRFIGKVSTPWFGIKQPMDRDDKGRFGVRV